MLTSALVNVLANAILSGEQEKDAIVTRLGHVLGRNWRWIRPLAGRYLETFTGRTRPGAVKWSAFFASIGTSRRPATDTDTRSKSFTGSPGHN